MAKPTNKQIEAMRKLGMTEEEIADVIKSDEAIDKGEKLFELTAEQEKASKQARNSGTRKAPTVYKLDNADGKRSRKENPTKAGIIAEIAKFLVENSENACENVEITKPHTPWQRFVIALFVILLLTLYIPKCKK